MHRSRGTQGVTFCFDHLRPGVQAQSWLRASMQVSSDAQADTSQEATCDEYLSLIAAGYATT